MKITVRGIDKRDRFVHRIAPSSLVDIAYVDQVTVDGAVVLSLDPGLGALSSDADRQWFRELLVGILKMDGDQISEVVLEFE